MLDEKEKLKVIFFLAVNIKVNLKVKSKFLKWNLKRMNLLLHCYVDFEVNIFVVVKVFQLF